MMLQHDYAPLKAFYYRKICAPISTSILLRRAGGSIDDDLLLYSLHATISAKSDAAACHDTLRALPADRFRGDEREAFA